MDCINKINWNYRCGFSSETNFERLYKSEIDGIIIWKNATRNKTTYTIGEKSKKYNTEQELINALKNG